MGYSVEVPFNLPEDRLTTQLSVGAQFAYGIEPDAPLEYSIVTPTLVVASVQEGSWVAVAQCIRDKRRIDAGQIRLDYPTSALSVLPEAERWIRESSVTELVAGRILQVPIMRKKRTDRLVFCGLLLVRTKKPR